MESKSAYRRSTYHSDHPYGDPMRRTFAVTAASSIMSLERSSATVVTLEMSMMFPSHNI